MSYLNKLPEDVERDVWRKVYDGCLKEVVQEALVKIHLIYHSWGDYDDDLSWIYFNIYHDALELNNLIDKYIADKVYEEDRNVGEVANLVDLIESDNNLWREG